MFNIPTGMINPRQYLSGAPNPRMDYAPLIIGPQTGGQMSSVGSDMVIPPNDDFLSPMSYPYESNYRLLDFINSKNPVVTPPRPPVPSQTPPPQISPPVTMGPPPEIDAPPPPPPVAPPSVVPPGNPVNTQPVQASDWFDYHDKKSKGINVLEPGKGGVTEGPLPGSGTAGGPKDIEHIVKSQQGKADGAEFPAPNMDRWTVENTGISVDTSDWYDAPYTVYNRYDPATDTYYGHTQNFAWGDGSKKPISMKGSEASQAFKDSWEKYQKTQQLQKPPIVDQFKRIWSTMGADETGGVGTKPPLPDETGGVRKSDPVQATDWFDYHDKKSKGIDVLAPPQPTRPEPPATGGTKPPPGFTPPSSMAVSMGLETFYNPTTGEEWTASTGGYTPGPGWVKGSKATYKSDPAVDQPQPPVSTDPLSPLENLYGQIGVSDEAAARDVINKILSGQAGDLTQAQQDLTGSGIYRRIANRLGMRDADGNLITPLSSVKTESGSTATPTSTQALQRLLDMENAESGSGIQLLLNYLQGRMRPPPPMPQPQPGPFGLVPGRGGFGMPGMGGGRFGMPGMGGGGFGMPSMGGGMYGMPRPPMFGNPYMNRMPFMGYAGMPNFRNPNIFGGYGGGFGGFGGPGVMGSYMAPMSYYGRQRPRFGRMPMGMPQMVPY